jgi:hypothetical protein
MVLYVSGVYTRCNRNRTKRDSDTRSKDQDFTHHLAPLVAPPSPFRCGDNHASAKRVHRQISSARMVDDPAARAAARGHRQDQGRRGLQGAARLDRRRQGARNEGARHRRYGYRPTRSASGGRRCIGCWRPAVWPVITVIPDEKASRGRAMPGRCTYSSFGKKLFGQRRVVVNT